jgi:hypothetical protein
MPDLEAVKQDLLAECRDDHVGLWSVIRYVEDAFPGLSPERIREITLDLLRGLLNSGRIEAGFPDTNGVDFHPWPFPAEAVIEQIQRHWLPTGPRPNIGEIAWFTAPSRLAV